jgi:hypothetical protein
MAALRFILSPGLAPRHSAQKSTPKDQGLAFPWNCNVSADPSRLLR